MEQVHSNEVKIIDSKGEFFKTDALITKEQNLALLVMVADCMPIIFFDSVNLVIAVIHAGREGTFLEIVKKTFAKMQENFQTKSEDMLVFFGPSIKKCCYEVNEKIAKDFRNKFGYDCISKNAKGNYFLDLAKINLDQLLNLGFKKENIKIANICTCCNKNYFSYRREGEKTGRFGGLVYLT